MPELDIEPNNPIDRLLTTWSKFNLPLKLATMAVFFGLTIVGIYAFLSSTGRIAFISNGGPVPSAPVSPPVTPPITPTPSPSPNCISGVTAASISGACSTQGFYYASYKCADGRSISLGDGKTCLDIYATANQAARDCGNICTPFSPRPSIRPTSSPKPSIPPSPQF